MTSEDEKTVHQQSITEVGRALDYVDVTTRGTGFQVERWSVDNDENHLRVLANEVRRLREAEEKRGQAKALRVYDNTALAEEVERLREKYDLEQKTAFVLAQKLTAMGDELAVWQAHAQRGETDLADARNERDGLLADRAAFEKVYETHTNQLRAKLRRVGALPAQWRLQQRIHAREAALASDLATELEAALVD